jgi:hypothetical protein
MVQRIKYLFLIVSLSSTPLLRADLDLTPATTARKLDGASIPELLFSDGSQKVSYESPHGWSYSAVSSREIRFQPPQVSQAETTIESIPMAEEYQFDEKFIKKLKEDLVRSLPKSSTQIQLVSEVNDTLLINGQKTYEVTIGYQNYGQKYRISVLFANLGRQQLRFRVLARASDFDQVHRDFTASLCSLQWLKNGS